MTLLSNDKNPAVCPVQNAIQLVRQVSPLGQPSNLPVCFYPNKNRDILYLTGNKIASLFCSTAGMVYSNITNKEAKRYSAHSIWVWSYVLLDEAGKSPDFIKERLHCLGELVKMYLHDTTVIHKQHWDALAVASKTISDIIASNIASNSTLLDIIPEDEEMGDYDDKMD